MQTALISAHFSVQMLCQLTRVQEMVIPLAEKEVGMLEPLHGSSLPTNPVNLPPSLHIPTPHTDASYTDPLGDLPERPKTAARQRPADEDEFKDAELGDDLLPE